MADFQVGGLVTYTGDNSSLRGMVGVVERIDEGLHPMAAVDFGYTDMPIIKCFLVNLTAHEGASK
jgi:hypothetical protein